MASEHDTHDASATRGATTAGRPVAAADIIPRFSTHAHTHAHTHARKGAHGKVLVVGGSFEYTGAPFYAGMAALKTGADLVTVVCGVDAGLPLKALAPDLVVAPLLPSAASVAARLSETAAARAEAIDKAMESIGSLLDRVDVVVIGPGLGRDAVTLEVAARIIAATRAKLLPLVVDGDALFLAAERPELVAGHPTAVLTPNPMELERLRKKVLPDAAAVGEDAGEDAARLCRALRGVALLIKGPVDVAVSGAITPAPASADAPVHTAHVSTRGSPRRCGGQGDVLAGALGTFLSWARKHSSWSSNHTGFASPEHAHARVAACVGASQLTRTAARRAFAAHHRATTTPDILAAVGPAFDEAFPGSLYALDDAEAGED